MSISLSTKRKWIISLSELIGLILSFLPTIWIITQGGVIEDTFIDIAFSTLRLALLLRSIHLILVLTSLLIIFSLLGTLIFGIRKKKLSQKINFNSNKWFIFRVAIGVYLGYILGEVLFYLILNSIFYRNAFVTIPFFLGSALLVGVLGLLFGNPELSPKVINFLNNAENENISSVSKLRLIDSISKVVIFSLIALLLIIPNALPLFGHLPTPPDDPSEPYLNSSDLFDVEIVRLEHLIPSNISGMIEPENSDGKWYTYVYLPKVGLEFDLQFPVAFYLHGYSGIDINFYHSSLKALAQRGTIGIFAQYATNIKLQGADKDIKFDHPADNPELYVRYAMEWSGISQAVDALNLKTSAIGSQTLLDTLGTGYTIDFSRLLIIGHSLGGGMTPFITTKSVKQGWGNNELILDMEAPWYESTWEGYQSNYTILPSHTIINVVTYEDDHSVSQCIGMDFYENIRQSNGTLIPDNQLNYIYLYSDFHGFPRLLASHYVPIDPIDDPLHQYGYKKRIKAMAYYLYQSANDPFSQLDTVLGFFLGDEVENMGEWSDDRPVRNAYTTNDPYGIRDDSSLVPELQDSTDDMCIAPINR